MKKNPALFAIYILAAITLFSMGSCKQAALDPILVNVKWILENIHYSDENIVIIEDTFSLLFEENSGLDMVVDCNTCKGTYEASANETISVFAPFSCTEVYCGDNSRAREFEIALQDASSYNITSDRLYLYFNNGSSYLYFYAEGTND